MKLSNYSKFARLIGLSPSLVEGNTDLKVLADIYAELKAKKLKKDEVGWKIAFPIAKFPELRRYFRCQ